jgi:hypothetical protein
LFDKTPALALPDLAAEKAWYEDRLTSSRQAADRDRKTAAHEYTDCSSIGPAKEIADGADDVGPEQITTPGGTPHRQSLPSVDLRRVRVAGSADSLCFDFETAGPVKAPIAMIVNFRPPGDPSSGFAFDTVLTAPDQAVLGLRFPGSDQHPLTGEVGVSGNRMSTLIGRDQFPRAQRALLAHFEWSVESVYHGPLADRQHISQFDDEVPGSSREAGQYP